MKMDRHSISPGRAIKRAVGKMLRRLSVRAKMTAMIVFVALVSSLIAYWIPSVGFQPITDVVFPKFIIANDLTGMVRQMRVETVNYVAFSDGDNLNGLEVSVVDLEQIREEAAPFLEGGNEQTPAFQTLFNQAEQISLKSQEAIEAHQQTVEMMERLELLDDDARDIFATHDVNVIDLLLIQEEDGTQEELPDTENLRQVQLSGQFVESFRIVQLETIEYVANGEANELEKRENELAKLNETLAELETAVVASDDSFTLAEGLITDFIRLRDRMTAVSTDTVNAHQNTLRLLNELTDLERNFDETIAVIEDQIAQNIEDSLITLTISILISAAVILVGATVLGLTATNMIITRPLDKLVNSAQKLGKGDLSIRIRIDTEDEIGQLGQTLNHMAARLQQTLSSVTAQVNELQKTKANLETANLELEQFAYIAAHDLKSPLRAIANLAEWLEEDIDDSALTDETRRYLQLLHARIQRMEALIDGLRDYSRSGRMNDKPEIVNTEEVVQTAADLLDIPDQFTLQIPSDMPVFNTYRQDLEQVFFQLIGNAVKHCHRSAGQIEITWQESGDFYIFTVGDDGPGIAYEYHEKVFFIFQTLEARDKVEGVGLGLPLVKKLVENYGGKVKLESAVGEGVTVQFSWPKQEAVKTTVTGQPLTGF